MASLGHLSSSNHKKTNNASLKNLSTAVSSACLGSIAFGYMIGYSSPAVPDMEWQGILQKQQLSWFSSLVAVGAIPGSLVSGHLLEQYGRKGTLLISVLPYVLGWLSIIIASSAPVFYIGRLMTGFATGIVSAAVPIYLSEIATKDIRGLIGAVNQLGITFGILVVYALGLTFGYRWLAVIALLPPIGLSGFMIFMPETPRWLISKGFRADAKSALVWLRESQSEVENEISDMEESMDPAASSKVNVAITDFLKPELRHALMISVSLMAFQQLGGINAVMFNIVDIFLDSGFKESGALAAVIVGVVQFLATVASCLVIDRWGRRWLLILTGIGMGMSCFLFAYYYQLSNIQVAGHMKWLPLCSLSLFIIAFSLGWGPVPSLIMSEVFPTKARSVASSLSVTTNWLFAFMITKEFMSMQELLGKDGVFMFFGACSIIGSIFVYHYVPETKGKSLEDIELYFLSRSMNRGRDV